VNRTTAEFIEENGVKVLSQKALGTLLRDHLGRAAKAVAAE